MKYTKEKKIWFDKFEGANTSTESTRVMWDHIEKLLDRQKKKLEKQHQKERQAEIIALEIKHHLENKP